ncbi:DUF4232 domain-containing protein [Amycolatopsis sp. NPDC051903]|uniref:DUF4232 domain-containing protein n=1 Tax=Amycolatopsis sp. NPDC051903 TaxID=3363936 RepID=UPI00378D4E5A
MSEVPLCGPDDLAVSLYWERDGQGLRGTVVAENVGTRTCRSGMKPGVQPLGLDGVPLPTDTLVSAEMRRPAHVVLEPGDRAAAPVSWRNWTGAPAGDRAIVGWNGGESVVVVEVDAPRQPGCRPGVPENLTSSWFNPLD